MKFIKVANDIDILVKDSETKEDRKYLSRIEKIGKNSLLITPPFIKGCYCKLLQAEIGKIINGCIAADGCSYFFECELISCKNDSNAFWEISLPANIQRVQRRQHVRLAIILDVTIEYIDIKKNIITTVTKDISAGGVQVVLEEPLPDDLEVTISLPLTEEMAVETKGEIVRVVFPKSPRSLFTMAIKFNEIPEEEQEKITKYIFKKEVQRRKKDKELFGKSLR